jgi:tetratricopeptide (TPR) repeat protein
MEFLHLETVYHLALETSFLADEGASLPEIPLNSPIVVALPDKSSSIERFISTILGFCVSDGKSQGPQQVDEYYSDVRYERIAILSALGAYYSYLGKIETKQKEKEDHFTRATQYYNKASRIDMHELFTWFGKGQLLLAKGDVEQASAAFKIVLNGDRDNVPALLGQACVEFNHGLYKKSLELYKRALQVAGTSQLS